VGSWPAEGEVGVRGAGEVELVGVGEDAFVAVGGGVEQDDLVAFGEVVAVQCGVAGAVRRM
jgi:hypothetical protein